MNKILVPFINNNETEAKLVSWDVDDESLVKKGDIIGSIETTKADIDLESEFEGIIKIIAIRAMIILLGRLLPWCLTTKKI